MNYAIPETQHAVQIVGPDQLKFSTDKPVDQPGPYQVLCRIEAVGLCFSDLKLLKQFSAHARKTPVIRGIDDSILREIPSYVPGDAPTVPGHEAVVRVVALGDSVKKAKLGGRYLVQTDYRWLPTTSSNASFGYNLEGALQEYVIMDERVITSPEGESFLIPASPKLSASAVALVEPWACVENAYATTERIGLKVDGHMLVVADEKVEPDTFLAFLNQYGRPAQITWISSPPAKKNLPVPLNEISSLAEVGNTEYDDVIYFGSNPETVEALFPNVAPRGLLNIALCGGTLGRDVITYVGRVHYGGIRIIGTTGSNPADSMMYIPVNGEIRPGDKINVIGAGGPMGVMHVIRNICQGVPDVTVFAGDLDEQRLNQLSEIAAPMAEKNQVGYQSYNPSRQTPSEAFDYVALMAPVSALVAQAVKTAHPRAIINVFAGIPATVTGSIDLDSYIKKQLYFIGTSGSVLQDMKTVLKKIESNRLDTDLSVAAVCSLEGAIDGIRAVEKQMIPGKVLVYPACRNLPLMMLEELAQKAPQVTEQMTGNLWNKNAEQKLLETYKRK